MQSRGVHGDEAASAEPNGAKRRAVRDPAGVDRRSAARRRTATTISGGRPAARRSARSGQRDGRGRPASSDGVSAQLVALLQEQLHDLRRRLDEAERERLELGQLLAMTAGTLADLARRLSDDSLAPAAAQATAERPADVGLDSTPAMPAAPVGWWQRARTGKRGLGAALTLAGAAGVLAGIALRVAMELHALNGRAFVGYIVGGVGLVVLLIGLALVA